MVPAKVKLGQAVLDLSLPAWLVVRLRLSATTPKSVPEDMLKTVLEYSRFLSSTPERDVTSVRLEDDSDISQRSMSMKLPQTSSSSLTQPEVKPRSATLIYPRCAKKPYTGPGRALSYRWAWSVEKKACVVYPYGGYMPNDVEEEAENTFINKYDCVLKCAPIQNQEDQIEVAEYLAAGDPVEKPEQLLARPTIPLMEKEGLRQKMNIPRDRVGFNLPNQG